MKANKNISILGFALFLCLFLFLPIQVKASENTITLTADVPEKHTVSLRMSEHGSIMVDGQAYDSSQAIPVTRLEQHIYTFIPNNGYELDKVVYQGETVTVDNDTFTAPAINQDGSIEVSFKKSSTTPIPDKPSIETTGNTTTTENVKTGDITNPIGSIILFLFSGIALFWIMKQSKQHM